MEIQRIEVLNTSSQSASLIAGYSTSSSTKQNVLNYNLIGSNGPINFNLSAEEVEQILTDNSITVSPNSLYSDLGVFSIGRCTNYLYSLDLHPDPESLQSQITELLSFSIARQPASSCSN